MKDPLNTKIDFENVKFVGVWEDAVDHASINRILVDIDKFNGTGLYVRGRVKTIIKQVPVEYLNMKVAIHFIKMWQIILIKSHSVELFDLMKGKIKDINASVGDNKQHAVNIVEHIFKLYQKSDIKDIKEYDDLLAALINHGADYNCSINFLIKNNLEKTLEAVLKNQPEIDVNFTGDNGELPLKVAMAQDKRNYTIINLLIRNGADFNDLQLDGGSSFLHAILSPESYIKGQRKCCALLLEHGASFKDDEEYKKVNKRFQKFYNKFSFLDKFNIAVNKEQHYAAANLCVNELLNCFGMGNKKYTINCSKTGKITATALSNVAFAATVSCIVFITAALIAATLNRGAIVSAADSFMNSIK